MNESDRECDLVGIDCPVHGSPKERGYSDPEGRAEKEMDRLRRIETALKAEAGEGCSFDARRKPTPLGCAKIFPENRLRWCLPCLYQRILDGAKP